MVSDAPIDISAHQDVALSACIGIALGAVAIAAPMIHKHSRYPTAWVLILVAGLAVTFLTVLSLWYEPAAWQLDAIPLSCLAILLAVAGTTLAEFLARSQGGPLWPTAFPSGIWRKIAFTVGLGVALLAGLVLGIVIVDNGGSISVTTIAVAKHAYRVDGTCADGSCVLNECSEPAPCGLKNVGRLQEGELVDIVCQLRGRLTEAPNSVVSHVWNRLASGAYVSDLFVNTPRTNGFSPQIPRCPSRRNLDQDRSTTRSVF